MKRNITVNGVRATMGELRLFVINRDGVCLGYLYDRRHVCADRWSRGHPPYDRLRLTLEHVPRVHSIYEGRVDNERHCVTLCHGLNVGGPPAGLRDWCRAYLLERYPSCDPEQEEQ